MKTVTVAWQLVAAVAVVLLNHYVCRPSLRRARAYNTERYYTVNVDV